MFMPKTLHTHPDEFNNLWNVSEKQDMKLDLLKKSFDTSMFAMDRGPERVGPM